ncbi:putative uncharacterized protein DDB_G0291812 [Anthonomus grandis grandis]|uniref:putative uncharacterized protein DDB_G0291812 n=1 Tax=Anthonomus grandis grandis TaxID=2921223 RepID=UPI0021666DBC|nr:putative uncharacterized protein DDB_G0291812 [Anthonomus grandis grandis]
MKYHTLGSSNLTSENKTSGFTLYADLGLSENDQTVYTETDMKKLRKELEMVQKDLKLQTKRCRHLVAEYTRRLQEKEELYQNEKTLRDTQLARVLRALLIFESRLKQEQKLISHQLNEKDEIIKAQTNDIKLLLSHQYCKNCHQYYTPPCTLESFDSSSEYAGERDYLSSNMESLDSSSDTYAAVERDYSKSESENDDKLTSKNIYKKGKSYSEVRRKVGHKKNICTYFEVLKLRNDSPLSNDDNTSTDLNNLDSLPPESISDKISIISENIDNMLNKTRSLGSPASESSANISSSECDKTVINTKVMKTCNDNDNNKNEQENNNNNVINIQAKDSPENKLTDTIPVFENSGDLNDNWYASASDQEDEDHRDVYRNNPVLECMNQILLQNINDINSPPKTPHLERKNNKRVKFLDEEDQKNNDSKVQSSDISHNDYYETPIQKTANFYETPQSIYSNDYEQILSRCSDSGKEIKSQDEKVSKEGYDYVQMEKDGIKSEPSRKSKILRVPPALPPKPANLVSKCKFQTLSKQPPSENGSTDLEPDYCSISELNLPQNRAICGKKISVVAEVHNSVNYNVKEKILVSPPTTKKIVHNSDDILVLPKDNIPNLVVKKCIEKLNVQMAKQTLTRPQQILTSRKSKNDIDIPKLPQVSEIIIPDDPDDKDSDIISQDNYVKNKTQIKQEKQFLDLKKPIVMGSSVSNLISGFNNHHILNELKQKVEPSKLQVKRGFSSFEKLQNFDKPINKSSKNLSDTPRVENFDLSQNFEEFKLDDCEIEEYDVEEELEREELEKKKLTEIDKFVKGTFMDAQEKGNFNHLEKIRERDGQLQNHNPTSLEIVKRQADFNKCSQRFKDSQQSPITYEHFLECTGLSSKSILTPARTLTNHKHMLKPKDIKHRSKVKANTNILEKHGGSAIRYWSEPYV